MPPFAYYHINPGYTTTQSDDGNKERLGEVGIKLLDGITDTFLARITPKQRDPKALKITTGEAGQIPVNNSNLLASISRQQWIVLGLLGVGITAVYFYKR